MPAPVQATRAYRSELRARQAGETRQRIVRAAAQLFAELGYARTTLKAIAERAQVSPETVTAHGPKTALMRAATELLGLGTEGVDDTTELPEVAAMLTLPPHEMAAYYRAILESIRANWGFIYDHGLDVYGWTGEQYATRLGSTFRNIWLSPPDPTGDPRRRR